MLRLKAFNLQKKRLALFTLAILTLSFSSVEGLKAVYKISMPPSLNKIYVPVILHYDSYFYSSPVKMLEKTLRFLISMNFPIEKLSITVWRDVLEKDNLFYDLKSRLEKYGFSWDSYHVGLFLPPEDANDRYILELAMEDYKGRFGNYPFFVAGFAASNDTYLWLEKYGVRISFFNLWEDGQDYSFRGRPCPDRIKGANWEGSPFQPYKPSLRSSNVPGLHLGEEVDIWECMWIFRNPSYAYLKANFAGWGSIHPGDLLISLSPDGSIKTSSVEEAMSRLNSILDLVELNAYYNRFLVLSYVTELYSLQKFSDRFEVWKRSVLEFKKRGYVFVNPRNLRTILDSQASVPSTPAYFWVDNSTNSDFIRRGEELPFAMVVSPYGRFIFCRRDPEADPYTPHLSVVSYLSAKAFNRTFQSIREAIGGGLMKLNVMVNGTPIFMRWKGDISEVRVIPKKEIIIEFNYTKGEVSFLRFIRRIHLTPLGVYVQDSIEFTSKVYVDLNFLQYLTLGSNFPGPPADDGILVLDDKGTRYLFSGENNEVIRIPLDGEIILFRAGDGYSLALRTLCKPERTFLYDERMESRWETLSFYFEPRIFRSGESINFSYMIIPGSSIGEALLISKRISRIISTSNP